MTITEEQFFSENLIKINRMISNFLTVANIVPLLLVLLTYLGLFRVEYDFSVKLLAITLALSFSDFLLVKKCKNQRIPLYFGVVFLNLLITFMGTHAHIGIYISFCFPPILSSLYYSRRRSYRILAISYAMMLISLYFKSQTIVLTGDFPGKTPMQWFCPCVAGFTIEFFFTALIVRYLTMRNYDTLVTLFSTLDERKKILDELNENNKKFELKNSELEETQFKIIQFVAECLGSHDLFTGRHVVHTRTFVEIIAKKLRDNGFYTDILTDEEISLYSSAAFLHDIGKIHIPEGVLNKVGKFTDDEFKLMKEHPEEGKKLLEFLPRIADGRFNEIAKEMAFCHHEKWDGTGYPSRMSGTQIPLCARIMAAADVLDALISQRLYKEPMSIEQAMDVFEKSMNSHFEACIAQAVIDCRSQIEEIDAEYKHQESEKFKKELEWWRRYHGISN